MAVITLYTFYRFDGMSVSTERYLAACTGNRTLVSARGSSSRKSVSHLYNSRKIFR